MVPLSSPVYPDSGYKHGGAPHHPIPTRRAVHECGCVVEYATDRHGEYPLVVEGCAVNERVTELLVAGEMSTPAYLFAVKGHRGREVQS